MHARVGCDLVISQKRLMSGIIYMWVNRNAEGLNVFPRILVCWAESLSGKRGFNNLSSLFRPKMAALLTVFYSTLLILSRFVLLSPALCHWTVSNDVPPFHYSVLIRRSLSCSSTRPICDHCPCSRRCIFGQKMPLARMLS